MQNDALSKSGTRLRGNIDRLVTQHAMRRFAPANVEQLIQEHGVVFGRAQQPLAVARGCMVASWLARNRVPIHAPAALSLGFLGLKN